jgi:uncharacterized protein YndB with AHSA1/START domain
VSLDFTVGGRWRFVEHADGQEHPFRGEIRAIDAPRGFTWTFEYEPMPGHIAVEQYDFTEADGKTTVTVTATFSNQEDRDTMIKSDMEAGAELSYRALDEYLLKL